MRRWPLILATRNKGKVEELRKVMADFPQLEVIGLNEVDLSHAPNIVEDGDAFYANALKKALAVADYSGKLTLADDSGLEVDALDGKPGVYSARFAGDDSDDAKNNQKLLELLQGVPLEKRTARFRCVLVLADYEGEIAHAEGVCEGIILDEPRGDGGFGYDPLFYIPEKQATMAELSTAEKNSLSHRGKAMQEMKQIFNEIFSQIKRN